MTTVADNWNLKIKKEQAQTFTFHMEEIAEAICKEELSHSTRFLFKWIQAFYNRRDFCEKRVKADLAYIGKSISVSGGLGEAFIHLGREIEKGREMRSGKTK